MTEAEAREESARLAGPSTLARLERFAAILTAEAEVQNLVSRSSLPNVWSRHILDSLQLVSFARPEDRRWIDVGAGAGFPGLIVAMLERFDVVLAEPRRRRADFLNASIERLELKNVSVEARTAQQIQALPFDIVSARAVASTADLLAMSIHFAKASTRFIFPKGERAANDVETARRYWHGVFHVEQSRTSPASGIVVIDQVRVR